MSMKHIIFSLLITLVAILLSCAFLFFIVMSKKSELEPLKFFLIFFQTLQFATYSFCVSLAPEI